MIRTAALAIVRAARAAWIFVASRWPMRRAATGSRNHDLDALRRRYVFGALNREGFEAARKRLRRR